MKTLQILFTLTVACLFVAAEANAQRGGRGGDRGGDRGSRGGDSGGRPSFGGRAAISGDTGGRPSFGGGRPSFGGDSGGRPSFGGRGDAGGRGGFDPTSRMDRNGDGRIDQSEIEAIPSFVRDSMKQRGIEMKPGSLDDVRNNMRAQFERVREEGGWGRSSDGESSTYGNRQKYAPASSFRPREKERMTVDLPEDYMGVDSNADGQVALHEWIMTRRTEMSVFEQIDSNSDGVLTPVELVAFENQKDGEEEAEKWIRERLVIVGPGGSSGGRDSGGSSGRGDRRDGKGDAKDEKQKHEQFAAYAFKAMDRNKNGKIDSEEWQSSRRVRPMFEKAGYKLTDMGSDEFSKRYVKAAMSDKK